MDSGDFHFRFLRSREAGVLIYRSFDGAAKEEFVGPDQLTPQLRAEYDKLAERVANKVV
jgi:hypothetical protein